MKVRQMMSLAVGLVLAVHSIGCSAILGIGDLPPATDGGTTNGAPVGDGGGGIFGMSPSNISSSSAGTCNLASANTLCELCIYGSCCGALASCANDPNCAGAAGCFSSESTDNGLCTCLSGYGGFSTIAGSSLIMCVEASCESSCASNAAPTGAACSTTDGCLLGRCAQDPVTGEDLCFQFCCSDSDCPTGLTCNVFGFDIAGNPAQYCAN